jgi:hypothetical protein
MIIMSEAENFPLIVKMSSHSSLLTVQQKPNFVQCVKCVQDEVFGAQICEFILNLRMKYQTAPRQTSSP